MCRHWDLGNDGDAGTDAVRVDGFKIGESMCCVDDWSVWLGARGGDAVALFDTRRASGPPRSLTRDRWHAGTVDDPPVALYGVCDGGVGVGGGGGAARGFGLGCFARGGDDAFIVAPLTDDCGSRCSVYTSAHHGLDSGAGDDGFDEDFDAFADDELMQTNEAGEALAEGDADIAADERALFGRCIGLSVLKQARTDLISHCAQVWQDIQVRF